MTYTGLVTIKKPPAPTFFKGYSFGGSYWVGCLPRNPFEEEKGFTLHWNVMGKTNSNTNHGFRQLYTTTPNHCQGARLTWIRVFTFNGFEEQVGRRFDCTGSILSQTNICLCLDSAAGRAGVFRQGTSLGSWTISPGNPGLLLFFTSRLINS